MMRACDVDLGALKTSLDQLSGQRAALAGRRRRRGRQADRRLPARDPARGDPRPVLGPRRSHRRQRAGRHLLRAREPRRLLPARAGHDPLRRGQLHRPRHRQEGRRVRSPSPSRARRGGRGEAQRSRPAARRSKPTASNLNEKAQQGKVDPLIGRDGRGRALRSRSCAAGPRTTRCWSATPASARPPSPRAWPARSSTTRSRRSWPARPSSRSTWARCWPAPAIAATSRSASSRWSRSWRTTPTRSCSSTRSTR